MNALPIKLLPNLQTALPALRYFNLSAAWKYGTMMFATAAVCFTILPWSVSASSDVPKYVETSGGAITDANKGDLLSLVAGDKTGDNLFLLRAYRKDGTVVDFYPAYTGNTVKVGEISSLRELGPVTILNVSGDTLFRVSKNPIVYTRCRMRADGTEYCKTYCIPSNDPECP